MLQHEETHISLSHNINDNLHWTRYGHLYILHRHI